MSAALTCAAVASDFSIELIGLAISLTFVALYAGFAYANAWSQARRDPQVMFVLGSTAQIVLITVVMSPLTYVAAAANFPLQDGNLLALDRALGLDWEGYIRFVNDHPLLADWLSYGYTMIRWPLFAIPVVLAAAQRYVRLQAFTLAFGLALIATTIISALVPAIGVYQEIGLDPASLVNLHPQAYLDQVRDLGPVRAGALRELDLFGLAGIVTFPSFHAASAVLYAWALWPVRWIRPIAVGRQCRDDGVDADRRWALLRRSDRGRGGGGAGDRCRAGLCPTHRSADRGDERRAALSRQSCGAGRIGQGARASLAAIEPRDAIVGLLRRAGAEQSDCAAPPPARGRGRSRHRRAP